MIQKVLKEEIIKRRLSKELSSEHGYFWSLLRTTKSAEVEDLCKREMDFIQELALILNIPIKNYDNTGNN